MSDERNRRSRRFFNTPMGFVVTDPGNGGAISPSASGTCSLVSGGAEGRTLADPTEHGLVLTISAKTVVGTITVVVQSAFNAAGNTQLPFDTVMDTVVLQSVWNGANLRWRLMSNSGVTPA